MATSYYAPRSGVGLAGGGERRRSARRPASPSSASGLGNPCLAIARPGKSWTFFEIDPAVVRIARDPEPLHLPPPVPARARIAIGDARLLLKRRTAGGCRRDHGRRL